MYHRDLVIFGLDGVLVDLTPLRAAAWTRALADAGMRVDGARLRVRLEGVAASVLAQSIEGEFGQPLPEGFLAEVERRLTVESDGALEPVSEVLGAIRRLRSTLAVVALDGELVARHALEQLGLWRRFTSHLFTADQAARVPPAPDLYQLAASQLGVPAARCLVVESTAHGVRGGKAAGMRVFGFAGAGHVHPDARAAQLRAAGADLVFDRMRELPLLVGAHAA